MKEVVNVSLENSRLKMTFLAMIIILEHEAWSALKASTCEFIILSVAKTLT